MGTTRRSAGHRRDGHQCAARECLEETGIVAEITGFLGVYTHPNHIVAYTDGEIRLQYENTYIGRPVGGEPTINDEADGVRFVRPADLDQYDIHPSMRQQSATTRRDVSLPGLDLFDPGHGSKDLKPGTPDEPYDEAVLAVEAATRRTPAILPAFLPASRVHRGPRRDQIDDVRRDWFR